MRIEAILIGMLLLLPAVIAQEYEGVPFKECEHNVCSSDFRDIGICKSDSTLDYERCDYGCAYDENGVGHCNPPPLNQSTEDNSFLVLLFSAGIVIIIVLLILILRRLYSKKN